MARIALSDSPTVESQRVIYPYSDNESDIVLLDEGRGLRVLHDRFIYDFGEWCY